MTSIVSVCDVKSSAKHYACLKIVNNKMKMNMTCVSTHRCLWVTCVQEKGVLTKGNYFSIGNKSKGNNLRHSIDVVNT